MYSIFDLQIFKQRLGKKQKTPLVGRGGVFFEMKGEIVHGSISIPLMFNIDLRPSYHIWLKITMGFGQGLRKHNGPA
jgi:hypothetical protein